MSTLRVPHRVTSRSKVTQHREKNLSPGKLLSVYEKVFSVLDDFFARWRIPTRTIVICFFFIFFYDDDSKHLLQLQRHYKVLNNNKIFYNGVNYCCVAKNSRAVAESGIYCSWWKCIFLLGI